MIKTSISPPPPERPDSEVLRHLNALEDVIKSRKYRSKQEQDADLEHLSLLRQSLAPTIPQRPRTPRNSSDKGLFGGIFSGEKPEERRQPRRRQEAAASEPQASSTGLTQLWQQVISELAVNHRALGMLLAQQSLLVRIQEDVALVMVKKMWLPSIRKDVALIERELREVLGRQDLKLSLKAAAADASREGER